MPPTMISWSAPVERTASTRIWASARQSEAGDVRRLVEDLEDDVRGVLEVGGNLPPELEGEVLAWSLDVGHLRAAICPDVPDEMQVNDGVNAVLAVPSDGEIEVTPQVIGITLPAFGVDGEADDVSARISHPVGEEAFKFSLAPQHRRVGGHESAQGHALSFFIHQLVAFGVELAWISARIRIESGFMLQRQIDGKVSVTRGEEE